MRQRIFNTIEYDMNSDINLGAGNSDQNIEDYNREQEQPISFSEMNSSNSTFNDEQEINKTPALIYSNENSNERNNEASEVDTAVIPDPTVIENDNGNEQSNRADVVHRIVVDTATNLKASAVPTGSLDNLELLNNSEQGSKVNEGN